MGRSGGRGAKLFLTSNRRRQRPSSILTAAASAGSYGGFYAVRPYSYAGAVTYSRPYYGYGGAYAGASAYSGGWSYGGARASAYAGAYRYGGFYGW